MQNKQIKSNGKHPSHATHITFQTVYKTVPLEFQITARPFALATILCVWVPNISVLVAHLANVIIRSTFFFLYNSSSNINGVQFLV